MLSRDIGKCFASVSLSFPVSEMEDYGFVSPNCYKDQGDSVCEAHGTMDSGSYPKEIMIRQKYKEGTNDGLIDKRKEEGRKKRKGERGEGRREERKGGREERRKSERTHFLRAWTEADPVLEKRPKSTPGSVPVSALILKGHRTPALIAPLSWN